MLLIYPIITFVYMLSHLLTIAPAMVHAACGVGSPLIFFALHGTIALARRYSPRVQKFATSGLGGVRLTWMRSVWISTVLSIPLAYVLGPGITIDSLMIDFLYMFGGTAGIVLFIVFILMVVAKAMDASG